MSLSPDLLEAKRLASSLFLQPALIAAATDGRSGVGVHEVGHSPMASVHAVGAGRKVVGGVPAQDRVVRIYVRKKLPLSRLSRAERIPSRIDGLPTDVIESSPAVIQQTPILAGGGQGRRRPVVAGVSTGHFNVTAGTLACFCRSMRSDDPPGVYVLSNNHIFADVNRGSTGDPLRQPSPQDGGGDEDKIAELHRFVKIALGGGSENRVDAAIGRLLPGVAHENQILEIGSHTGTERAVEDMVVRKHGRTTGYTEGVVFDESYDAMVGMDHGDPSIVAFFRDQMRITRQDPFAAFALGGDSGSLVLRRDGAGAVGLYFAGSPNGSYGVANHIDDVLTELEIELL
jgi:hypothetical protein